MDVEKVTEKDLTRVLGALETMPVVHIDCPCGKTILFDPRESRKRCTKCGTENITSAEVFLKQSKCEDCRDSGLIPYTNFRQLGDQTITYIMNMMCHCREEEPLFASKAKREKDGRYVEEEEEKFIAIPYDEKLDNLAKFCPQQHRKYPPSVQREFGILELKRRKIEARMKSRQMSLNLKGANQ